MEELQPIAWRVWAGRVEREGKRMGRVNPWAGLEERVGFVDIRVCCSYSYISLDYGGLGKRARPTGTKRRDAGVMHLMRGEWGVCEGLC